MGLKPTPAGKVRHDVMEGNAYIPAPGRHLGLSWMEVGCWYVFSSLRVLNGFLARGLHVTVTEVALDWLAYLG